MGDLAVLSRDELRALLADAASEGARRVLAERAAADELIDVGGAARRLGVSVRQVRAWLASGALPSVRLPGRGGRGILRLRSSVLASFIAGAEQRDAPGDRVVDLAVARAARRAAR